MLDIMRGPGVNPQDQKRNKKPSWVGAWLDHIYNRARSTSGEDWETGQGVVAFFLALTFLPLKRFEHC